jgi:phage gpG-like protein
MITVKINTGSFQADLDRLASRLQNLKPALEDMGEVLLASTKQRFADSKAPDGTPWAPNSPVTMDQHLRRKGGDTVPRPGEQRNNPYYKKDGSLSKRGERQIAGKRPLIGESKRLGNEIAVQADMRRLVLGSSLIYAAVQQFGAQAGAFGRTKRGAPIPWGNIPARPFLGLSTKDQANIVDIVAEYLEQSFHP